MSVECPYCLEDQEINHDDGYGYEESETHEQTCSDCDKTFAYNTSISFNYSAHKADCLNDGEHDYKKAFSSHFPDRKVCHACGDEVRGELVWQGDKAI